MWQNMKQISERHLESSWTLNLWLLVAPWLLEFCIYDKHLDEVSGGREKKLMIKILSNEGTKQKHITQVHKEPLKSHDLVAERPLSTREYTRDRDIEWVLGFIIKALSDWLSGLWRRWGIQSDQIPAFPVLTVLTILPWQSLGAVHKKWHVCHDFSRELRQALVFSPLN